MGRIQAWDSPARVAFSQDSGEEGEGRGTRLDMRFEAPATQLVRGPRRRIGAPVPARNHRIMWAAVILRAWRSRRSPAPAFNRRVAMVVRALFIAALLFTAITFAAGLAHALSLPNKIHLSADDYLTVQQIYRGWALLGIAMVGALLCAIALGVATRGSGLAFGLTLLAALCIAASLLVFFVFTYPANQATVNWTRLTADWQRLRASWEYSHAAGAGLDLLALIALAVAVTTYRLPGPTSG